MLDVDDLSKCDVGELLRALKPDSLLERFAYRKQAGHHNNKEFIKLKGSRGQINHSEHETQKIEVANDLIGFKCLHYSVTESNGHVELTIVRKVQ